MPIGIVFSIHHLSMNKILDFMKRNYKIILAVLLVAVGIWGFSKRQIADKKEASIIIGTQRVIQYAHYQPKNINDSFSLAVWNKFIKDIDPSKRYFLQTDIDTLSLYKKDIDDEINVAGLDFYSKVYDIIKQRQEETLAYIDEILKGDFDFNKDEILNTDYEKDTYAKDKAELQDKWRKYLKFNVVSRISDKEKEERNKKEKDNTYQIKSFKELKKEAIEATQKSMKNYRDMIDDMEESDYFSMYMNAIVMQNDPHTNYFSPQGKERFDTSMSGSFEGIGARLQKDGDYVKIIEVIPGGPVWKNDLLQVGDLIQKVAQGDKDPVDIMGLKLSKVVKLIKGPKGTVVKLTIKRVNGSIEVVPITRDRVELEDTFAKSLLIYHKQKAFGYVYLPKFYVDFKEKNQRSAASDIKKELEKLKAENVQGIVLDLRNNGGGSLQTVVEMTGYFVGKGPVVQVKDKKNNVDVLKSKEKKIYDGKLVVLINELSASASEILAAALQDYKRAIIIGSQTYGKGTVQNFIDLTRVQGDEFGDLGAIKWTTKKFYRVNGGSTQIKGVMPDINLPDAYMYLDIREEDEPTALKWDQIEPAKYHELNIDNKTELVNEEQNRLTQSALFKALKQKAKWLADNRDDHTVYLKWDDYVKDIEKAEQKSKVFDSLTRFESDLSISSLAKDTINKAKDTVFKVKRKKWISALKKDPYVDEAVRVLERMP